MKNKAKKITGMLLTVFMVITMLPFAAMADTELSPEDSADYARIADPVAAGTTTEADEFFFTGKYIASYGNTYLEVMMADDFAGTRTNAGIFVKKITADYDNDPYPSDGRVYTGVYFSDVSQNVVAEMNEAVIGKLPAAMKGRLMKNEWSIGSKYGILNDAWTPENAVIRNYVAPPSKDVLGKYAPYLIDRIDDNEVTGSANDPLVRAAISSQQMSTYRLFVYSTTSKDWTDGAQSRHIKGSVFPHFYVDAKAFTEIKLDLATMGDNVKSLFVDKIPRAELAKAGYTDEELASIGYTDDYKFTLKSVELSADMSIGYRFVNNSTEVVNVPTVLAVGYDKNGMVVSANAVSVKEIAEANGGKFDSTIKLITDGVPASVVCYPLKSLSNPIPVTKAAAISHNVSKKPPVPHKIGFGIEGQEDGSFDFVVAGTLADSKLSQVFVVITKQGKTVADIAKAKDLADVLMFAEQTVTDANGGYGFKFSVSADAVKDGEYNACVWDGNNSQSIKLNHKTVVEEQVKPEQPSDTKVTFDDINEATWAKEYIEKLAAAGYVNGKDGKNFRPNDYITREEFVKILVFALGLKADASETTFNDVPANAWYAGYVNVAYKNGIVNGNGAGGFGTGGNITRQDLATMVYRASKMKSNVPASKFADDGEIAEYAKEAVYTLNSAGVLNGKGDNKFAPKALATRAEASKIIYLAIGQ